MIFREKGKYFRKPSKNFDTLKYALSMCYNGKNRLFSSIKSAAYEILAQTANLANIDPDLHLDRSADRYLQLHAELDQQPLRTGNGERGDCRGF